MYSKDETINKRKSKTRGIIITVVIFTTLNHIPTKILAESVQIKTEITFKEKIYKAVTNLFSFFEPNQEIKRKDIPYLNQENKEENNKIEYKLNDIEDERENIQISSTPSVQDYDWQKRDFETQEETLEEGGDTELLEIYNDIANTIYTEEEMTEEELNHMLLNASYERETFNELSERQRIRKENIEMRILMEEELEKVFQAKLLEEVAQLRQERYDRIERERQLALQQQRKVNVFNYDYGNFTVGMLSNEMNLIEKAMGIELENQYANEIKNLMPDYLGKPYIWGGDDRTTKGRGYDCSGFTLSVMNSFGKSIPRVSAQQFKTGTSVSIDNLKVGDLVFFDTKLGTPYVDQPTMVSHVGLYIGRGMMVHASSGSNRIRTEKVFGTYFAPRYMGARRY